MADDFDLADFARFVAARLREHFDPDGLPVQQVIALAEEAGEFTGAYRRWAGMARRPGSWEDVCAEMADVVITCHVTAVVLGIDLPAALARCAEPVERPAAEMVLCLHSESGVVSGAWVRFRDGSASLGELARRLADMACYARATAGVLGIDLDAACKAKAAVVAARPWKETADAR